jgi:hypothetical protein
MGWIDGRRAPRCPRPLPGPGRERLSPGCGLRTGAAGSARFRWRLGEGRGRSARDGRGARRFPRNGWGGDHAVCAASGPGKARDARRGCGGGARGAGAEGDGVDGERGCHRAREQAPKSARCGRGERGQGERTDRAGYEGPAGEGRRRAYHQYEDPAEFILRSSHDWIDGARCQYFCNTLGLQSASGPLDVFRPFALAAGRWNAGGQRGTRPPPGVTAARKSPRRGSHRSHRHGGWERRRILSFFRSLSIWLQRSRDCQSEGGAARCWRVLDVSRPFALAAGGWNAGGQRGTRSPPGVTAARKSPAEDPTDPTGTADGNAGASSPFSALRRFGCSDRETVIPREAPRDAGACWMRVRRPRNLPARSGALARAGTRPRHSYAGDALACTA